MQINDSKNKNKGFTLIEVIVAIFVITVGVLAAYNIIQQIMIYNHQAEDRLTAAYLAKEGIEIVRNIRDKNWLQGDGWDDGLIPSTGANCNTGNGCFCEADYSDLTLFSYCGGASPNFLNIESGNFYGYNSGSQTKFTRKIEINSTGDLLQVVVVVGWEGKSVTAQENLYDWYPGL